MSRSTTSPSYSKLEFWISLEFVKKKGLQHLCRQNGIDTSQLTEQQMIEKLTTVQQRRSGRSQRDLQGSLVSILMVIQTSFWRDYRERDHVPI